MPVPSKSRYVVVEGVIGVGKTTLVDMLARRFEGVKVLEDATNPFLDKFYKSHYSGYKDIRDKIMSLPSQSNVTTEPDEELEKRLKAAEEKDDKVKEKAEFIQILFLSDILIFHMV